MITWYPNYILLTSKNFSDNICWRHNWENIFKIIYFIVSFHHHYHHQIKVMKYTFSSNDQNCENAPFSPLGWKHLDGKNSLRWRHNECDSDSNHQPHGCLLNRLCRRRSKKTSKLRVTGLCAGNSPWTGEFPAQMASNAENVSIWWRHHVLKFWQSEYHTTPVISSCEILAHILIKSQFGMEYLNHNRHHLKQSLSPSIRGGRFLTVITLCEIDAFTLIRCLINVYLGGLLCYLSYQQQ